MSETKTPARPRQLITAASFVMGGSLILLVSVFDTMANLNSVDTRDQVADVLSSGGAGLDLTVAQALRVMRVGLNVAAVSAAAAAILGFFVLQRNAGARIALSVLAVPILVTAPLTGWLMAALVVAATVQLWNGPARDWFAGRPVREPAPRRTSSSQSQGPQNGPEDGPGDGPRNGPRDGGASSAQDQVVPSISTSAVSAPTGPAPSGPAPTGPAPTGPAPTGPVPTQGFGERPSESAPQSVAVADPTGPLAPAWATGSQSWSPATQLTRPVSVTVACLLTWVFSGLAALLYGGVLAVLVLAQDTVVDLVVSSPGWDSTRVSEDMLVPLLYVGCLVFLAWSLGACVLAVFTWRRHNWARYLLAASAGVALVAATFAFPFGVLHQIAAAVSIGALFRHGARAWFAREGASRPQGPAAPPGPPRVW